MTPPQLIEAHRLVEGGGVTGKAVVARSEADSVLRMQEARP